MAFFKRVFSADFRRALAAEAAGEYGEAARAYALAGERSKVGEMHLLAAERASSHEARLAELRSGLRWADADAEEGRGVRRRIARAMLLLVRGAGVISESDRGTLREAAALFTDSADFAGAGECHELAGDELQAAEAYQRAGEVERLEAVLAREERRRRRDTQLRDAYEEYSMLYAAGERDAALGVLRSSVNAPGHAGGDPGGDPHREHARLIESVEERRIVGSRVALRAGDDGTMKRLTCVGAFPLGLGREVSCEVVLRDAGISRRHAEILEAGGRFRLRDCASRNGTFLAGLAVDGELPLEREGDLRLGDACAFQFRVAGGLLELRATRGLDRGLRVLASSAPIALPGGAELRFAGGLPWLSLGPSAAPSSVLMLNGVRPGKRVQLLRGDVIEVVLAPPGGRAPGEEVPLARIEVDAWPSGSG